MTGSIDAHSLSAGHLQPECLGLVIEELFEVNPKWYTVGLMLGLHYSTLDTIKHLYNEEDYFREMLKSWFKHAQDCSWQALVRALTTSAVGEYALARKLERKYLHYGKLIQSENIKPF